MRGNDKQGAVLVIVLLVLAAASVLILESSKFLRIDYASASYGRSMVAGGSLLRSGLDVAKESLLQDVRINGDIADHEFDGWARIDEQFEEYSQVLQSGDLKGTIIAEDGRISLNALTGEEQATALGTVFVRLVDILCKKHGVDADPELFLASVKVWCGGADSRQDRDWYAMQKPAYSPAGRPFQSPHELLLVRWRGVSLEDRQAIYYGTAEIPGLRDFVTVWGDGGINVNVAPPEVLAALVPDSRYRAEFVHAVEKYRSSGENLLSGQWYNDIATRVGLDMTQFPSGILQVRSTVFRVQLTARIGAGELNSTTILKRESGECVTLFQNIH